MQDRRPQITAPGFHQALELQLKSRVVVSLQSTQNFLAMDTIMFGEKRDSRKRKSRHRQCKSWWWIAVRWHCYEKYHDILFLNLVAFARNLRRSHRWIIQQDNDPKYTS